MILNELLGENKRIQILEELLTYNDSFLTVEELSRMSDLSQKTVRNHLKQLKDIGILEVENKSFKLNNNDERVLALGILENHEFLRRSDEKYFAEIIPTNQLKYDYDEKGDSLLICLINHDKYKVSVELDNGAILDLDINNKPFALEFLDASELFNINKSYLKDSIEITVKLKVTRYLICLNCTVSSNNQSFNVNAMALNSNNVPVMESVWINVY